jgi:phosphatidylinositol-3-phosphatase
VALCGGVIALSVDASQATVPVHAAGVPAYDHVFVIVMENHPYNAIIGSSAAPYINSLLPSAGLATNYFAITHPSLPNYLTLTGGTTFGITSDCTTCWISASNIGDTVESAGKTWKAYEESMPSPCFVGDSYPYAQKHDPFIYYNDIRNITARCQSHLVPYTQLSSDLGSTTTTPNYAFITPNMCDDMHDCSIQTGDSWLQKQVPAILASPAFTAQNSLLAITWDEGDLSNNQVPLILLGSHVLPDGLSGVGYNHYSLLHTVEAALGLGTLTSSDAGAALLADLVGWPSPPPTSAVSGFGNWFDNASAGMIDHVHLTNPGTTASIGTVSVGFHIAPFNVPAGGEAYASFPPGTIGGPVMVAVTSGPAVLASDRVEFNRSFSEKWLSSAAQAATVSYFNWYDNASPGMDADGIHVLDPSGLPASVTISLPGAAPLTINLASGADSYASFPAGTIGGPVTVTSNQPVLASERITYFSSFTEIPARSAALAATTGYFDWYDNASAGMESDHVHLFNPTSSTASVTVSMPGHAALDVSVPAGGEAWTGFPAGTIGGPVTVASNLPVLASKRVEYNQSFSEIWAASAVQAAASSRFNWFDKASIGMTGDDIHLLNPGTTAAVVTVSLAGGASQQLTLGPGAETYATFAAGTIGGPVTINSTQPVIASQRVTFFRSFHEIWSAA